MEPVLLLISNHKFTKGKNIMSSMNQVILMGNLTRDPESRKTPTGMTVADFSLAISDSYKDKDGKWVDKACFVEVVAWDRQAETCTQFLKKGSPVLVEGKLQLDQWKNENGEKRSKLRVRAMRVQFLGKSTGGDTAPKTKTPVETEEEFEPIPF